MELNLSSTALLAPCPMLTMDITAPTPMIIPRAVRKVRILFRLKALKETGIVLSRFIFYSLFLFLDLSISEMDFFAGCARDIRVVGNKNNGDIFFLVESPEDSYYFSPCFCV